MNIIILIYFRTTQEIEQMKSWSKILACDCDEQKIIVILKCVPRWTLRRDWLEKEAGEGHKGVPLRKREKQNSAINRRWEESLLFWSCFLLRENDGDESFHCVGEIVQGFEDKFLNLLFAKLRKNLALYLHGGEIPSRLLRFVSVLWLFSCLTCRVNKSRIVPCRGGWKLSYFVSSFF